MRTVQGSHPRVTGRTEFEKLAGDIETLAARFKPKKTLVGVNLIGEKRMSLMNRIYKGRRGSAEILTFDYRSEDEFGRSGDDPAGEIYICWKRLAASATRRKVSRRSYLLRLLAHGLCHLKGFTHHEDAAARRMEKAEIGYLAGLVSSRDIDRLFDLTKRER